MRLPSPSCFLLLVFSLAACKQDKEIKVYRLAREAPQTAPAPAAAEPTAQLPGIPAAAGAMPTGPAGDPHAGLSAEQLAGGGSGSQQISDSPPANWKKQPASAMRQASYRVEGEGGASADISLIILRGAAGATLANVNRWREQLGQPAIDEAALKQNSKPLATPIGNAVVVDIEGTQAGADAAKDGRIVGAIADKDGDAWFFKMRGNAALTAKEKDNFMAWVGSVKAAAKPEATPAPAAGAAAGAAAAAAPPSPPVPAAASNPAKNDGALTWAVPAGWTLAPATGSMRYATFSITAPDGAKAEMAVTHFPGDVGGDLENVNRWRQQVGLAPVDQTGLAPLVSKITAGAKTFSLIDVTGAQSRLAAGWTRHGPDTWFFKLTGPDGLVSAEKAKFTSFLESIRFTQPE